MGSIDKSLSSCENLTDIISEASRIGIISKCFMRHICHFLHKKVVSQALWKAIFNLVFPPHQMTKGTKEFLWLLNNIQEYGHSFDVELLGLDVMNDAYTIFGKWWLKFSSIIAYLGCGLSIKLAKIQPHNLITETKKLIGIFTWNGAEIVADMLPAWFTHALQAIVHLREGIDDKEIPCAFFHTHYRV